MRRPRPRRPARQADRHPRRDLVLGALFAALVGWTALSPDQHGGRSAALTALGLAGAAFAVGRLLGTDVALRIAAALAVATAVLTVTLAGGAPSGEATAPPLGYGNANGALALLGAGASLVAALSVTGTRLRLSGAAAAGGFAVLAAATGSLTAAALAAGLALLGVVLAERAAAGRRTAAAAVTVLLTAVVGTALLAVDGSASGQGSIGTRLTLWAEALDLAVQAPVRGVGPGGFAALAPSAADPDLRWAHSLWLEQAAETGFVGAALLVALVAVVLLRPSGRRDGAAAAAGAAATAALLLHASVDYVLTFPVVLGGAALLAGLSDARRPPLPLGAGTR